MYTDGKILLSVYYFPKTNELTRKSCP